MIQLDLFMEVVCLWKHLLWGGAPAVVVDWWKDGSLRADVWRDNNTQAPFWDLFWWRNSLFVKIFCYWFVPEQISLGSMLMIQRYKFMSFYWWLEFRATLFPEFRLLANSFQLSFWLHTLPELESEFIFICSSHLPWVSPCTQLSDHRTRILHSGQTLIPERLVVGWRNW